MQSALNLRLSSGRARTEAAHQSTIFLIGDDDKAVHGVGGQIDLIGDNALGVTRIDQARITSFATEAHALCPID